MKNNKITPGPWHVEKDWKTVWQDTGGPGNAECVGTSPIWLIVHEQLDDHRLRTCVAQLDNSTEVEANAKAIAALPDLVNVALELVEYGQKTGWGDLALCGSGDKSIDDKAESIMRNARLALEKAGVL